MPPARLTVKTSLPGYWELAVATGQMLVSEDARNIHWLTCDGQTDVQRFLETCQAEDRNPTEELFARALAHGEGFQTDIRLLTPDAETRHVRLTALLREGSSGEDAIIAGFSEDVTETIRRTFKNRAYEELVKQFEKLNVSGYWFYDLPDDYLYWSDGNYRVHGLEVGSPVDPRKALDCYHPEDRKLIAHHLRDQRDEEGDFNYELRIHHPDGSEHFVKSSGGVRLGADGKVSLMFGLVQDITSERETSDTLKRSNAFFTAFVDHSPSATIVKDKDGKFLLANRKWHEWFNPEGRTLDGMVAREIYPEDVATEIESEDQQMVDAGKAVEQNRQTTIASGEVLPTLIQKFPILNADNEIIGIGSTNTDLSELKEANDTRTRLFEALENISDGYIFYDADRKFIYCNSPYREFYPWISDELVPGARLEDITRKGAERIQEVTDIGDIEEWIAQRLNDFEVGGESQTRVLRDGRIVYCSDGRSNDGGYIGTRTDISDLKLAEQELQDSENRFRRLFDTAEVSIWDEDFSQIAKEFETLGQKGVTDLANYLTENPEEAFRLATLVQITSVNEATLKLYGSDNGEDFIDRLSEIMTEETIKVFVGVLCAMWNRDDYFRTEATHKTFDGREITIFMSFPIPENVSDWQSVPVCIFDITDQKRTEVQLRLHQEDLESRVKARTGDLQASQEKLRDLLDGSLQGIIVHDKMKPLFVNDTYAEIHGRTIEELLKIDNMMELFAPGEHERIAEILRKRAAGEETPSRYEYQAVGKDGNLIWLQNRARRVNWDGKMVIQSTVIDITERKLAEDALIESEQRHRGILETSPIGMGITNSRTGMATYVNDAHLQILRISREEFFQTRGVEFWQDPSMRQNFVDGVQKNDNAYGEIQLKRKDGTTVWVVQRWIPNPSDDEEILFWTYEITELMEAQDLMRTARDEANRASQAKSEFLSSMSHELRTPLNSILGFGQLLEHAPNDPLSDDHQDSVMRIMTAGRHLLDLVNDVLDLATIESGSMAVTLVPTMPEDILVDCLHLISKRAEEAGITINAPELYNSFPVVLADGVRLKQVLLNLLSNAIKYNRDKGSVTVELGITDNRMMRFSIRDTGPGISEEDQKNLFVPFNRLGAEKTDIEGTGIGLAITRELVDLMNGRVGLQSTMDTGSTFWFELPLADN
jgi:PAS domain S-box-containing protein